jgi:hypothetical protein
MCAASRDNTILETDNIATLLPLLPRHNKPIILWDIDETLATTKTKVGGDPWFNGLYAHTLAKAKPIAAALNVYDTVQHHMLAKHVDPTSIKILKLCQMIGIPVLGLTARGRNLLDTTHDQLRSIDIDFSRNRCETEKSKKIQINDKDGKPLAVYYEGIIFCGGKNKGDCLAAFWKLIVGDAPNYVLMIDDKHENVERVRRAVVEELKLQFNGLLYTKMHEEAKNFDHQTATQELIQLYPFLPQETQQHILDLGLIPKPDDEKRELPSHFFPYDHNNPNRGKISMAGPQPQRLQRRHSFDSYLPAPKPVRAKNEASKEEKSESISLHTQIFFASKREATEIRSASADTEPQLKRTKLGPALR